MASVELKPQSNWEDISYPVSTILEMAGTLCREPLTWSQQACVNEISRAASRLLALSSALYENQASANTVGIPLRVLVVEDQEMIASIHQHLLTELGCEVDLAIDGKAALTLAMKNRYDLIFLDQHLPDIKGNELAKKLKAHFKERCPTLMTLTSLSGEATKKACLEAGIQQVYIKPLGLNDFKNILTDFNQQKAKGGLN